MSETTGIEWAHATWNPFIGCHKISPGCKNCYMFRDLGRRKQNPNEPRRAKTVFDAPLKWQARWKKDKHSVWPGSRIFTCSLSDWFIEEADPWRNEAWDIIRRTPEYTYLILTKRPERIQGHLPIDWAPYQNVWLGISAENQETADLRIPLLLEIPAIVHWVSAEPLLGPIDLKLAERWCDRTETYHECDLECDLKSDHLDWVVIGGESDYQNPRPMKKEWAIKLTNDCREAGIPVFFKQMGGSKKIDGHWGGNKLDGQIIQEFPK